MTSIERVARWLFGRRCSWCKRPIPEGQFCSDFCATEDEDNRVM